MTERERKDGDSIRNKRAIKSAEIGEFFLRLRDSDAFKFALHKMANCSVSASCLWNEIYHFIGCQWTSYSCGGVDQVVVEVNTVLNTPTHCWPAVHLVGVQSLKLLFFQAQRVWRIKHHSNEDRTESSSCSVTAGHHSGGPILVKQVGYSQ